MSLPPHERLQRWIEAHAAATVATVCGVAVGLVRRWCSKKARPAEHLRPAIYVLTGVPAWTWRTTEERAIYRAAMRRALRHAAGKNGLVRPKTLPLGLSRHARTARSVAR